MRVQAFVFDWPGQKQHATANAAVIRPFCPVEIIDNPDFYFTDQWECARSKFNGDILLTIMADVWPPDRFGEMFAAMVQTLSRDRFGIYAPAVEFVGHKLWRHKASQITANVYDTPVPEMLCWALHRSVVETMPHVDPKVNKFGWGIDYLAVAKSWRMGRRAVTDFNFLAVHQKGTGYGCTEATAQYEAWLETLPQMDRDGVLEVVKEQDRLCVNTTKKIVGGTGPQRAAFYQGLRNDVDRVVFEPNVPTSFEGWMSVMFDVQDLYVLHPEFSEDALRAAQINGVNNVWFLIPQNPLEWLRTYRAYGGDPTAKEELVNCWHWRHPHWELDLTSKFTVPVAWLLPAKVKYRMTKFNNLVHFSGPPYIPEPEGGM